MRRKYRPYVAIGAGLYLFIMWSAFHWEKAQHFADGDIFEHREHERIAQFIQDQKKLAEKQKEEEKEAQKLASTPGSRLNAGPAFVAVRYDADHVVFMVATDSESRFGHASVAPQKIAAPAQPSAHLAGLEELWATDSGASLRLPENVKNTVSGDQWNLSAAAGSTIPVTIDRAVTAPTGCALALGFLASVLPEHRSEFAAVSGEYFVVRKSAVAQADPSTLPQSAGIAAGVPAASTRPAAKITEITDWKSPAGFEKEIVTLLNQRMLQELARIDATLRANGHSPDSDPDPWLATNVRARRHEWLHRDKKLAAGEGKLDYDLRAFRLTPDGAPRVFVRARWKLDALPVFLMTAWLRAPAEVSPQGSSIAQEPVALLSADSSWSSTLREGRPGDTLGETLDFETILNEFDDDRDGWAELLVHSTDGNSAKLSLDLYTDLGLVPTKTSFQRELATPESCAEQR